MSVGNRQIRVWLAVWCLVAMLVGQSGFLGYGVPRAKAAPTFYLPWEAGSVWKITNGNGTGEHANVWNAYAFDAVPDDGRSTTNVTAIAAGQVIDFQNDIPNEQGFSKPNAGNCIMIQHEDGIVSLYAHLSQGSIPQELRQQGAEVRSGQVIGVVGNSGYADGVHLHWSVVKEGLITESGGVRSCYGESIPSQYADNDRELIEDGGVPRTGRYYESTNVDAASVQPPAEDAPGPSDDGLITAVSYDRNAAVDVAFGALHEGYEYDDDSANFVSKALWGGGLPRTSDWDALLGSPHDFATFLINSYDVGDGRYVQPGTITQIDWSDNTASGAAEGDVIAYDWEGDGTIDHVAFVTNLNSDGYPEVSEHSPSSENRYWSYSDEDDNWIELARPGSVAYLIHIDPVTSSGF